MKNLFQSETSKNLHFGFQCSSTAQEFGINLQSKCKIVLELQVATIF